MSRAPASTCATLYGVGLGPGAPDLLTLRAVETLRSADVLALPRSSDYGASVAWSIVEPAIGSIEGQERLFLTFPMSKDANVVDYLVKDDGLEGVWFEDGGTKLGNEYLIPSSPMKKHPRS
jgi:precorrin-2 methylase